MARSVMDVLAQVRNGTALHQANTEFQELCQRVRETGKGGELVIKIKVAPDKTDENVYEVEPDVTAKMPKKKMSKGIFYMERDGSLTREDPRQGELLPKDADTTNVEALERIGRG